MPTTPRHLLSAHECKAVLRWPGGELPVTANMTCDERAQVTIVVPSAPITDKLLALCEFFNAHQSTSNECSIDLQAESGQSVRSDHLWLSSWTLGTNRAELQFACSELWVTTPDKTAKSESEYGYLVRGLLSHGPLSADFDFGTVRVAGVIDKDDDRLSGTIIVTPRDGMNSDEIDSGVSRVLDVLSFATGRLLRSSMRQRRIRGMVELRIRPHGELFPPRWAPFHYLDLTEILKTAARTYTEAVSKSTGVGAAIHWTLAYSSYEAVRFVQLMIALEHMIQVAKTRLLLLPEPVFHDLRERLRQVVDAFRKTEPARDHSAECDYLRESLNYLNQRAFKRQIRQLLVEYRVPSDGLDEYIDELVNLRNLLVHQGSEPAETARQVAEHEMVLRDILARTFLAVLDFKGPYRSWFGGPHDVYFCRTPENVTPDKASSAQQPCVAPAGRGGTASTTGT